MKKQNVCFLLRGIFLIVQMYPIFCMEKENCRKKESDFIALYWKNFKLEFEDAYVVPNEENPFDNYGQNQEKIFPVEIKKKIARQLCPVKRVFELGSCEEYPTCRPTEEEVLYYGQTWCPGIPFKPTRWVGSRGPENIKAMPGEKSISQFQFWKLKYFSSDANIFQFKDYGTDKTNSFHMYAVVIEESVKFDGPNLEGNIIVHYKEQYGDAFIRLICTDDSRSFVVKERYTSFDKMIPSTISLKNYDCQTLVLGHNACALSVIDMKEKKNFVQTYTIVKKEHEVFFCKDKNMAVPEDCSFFKKLDYLRPEVLIGLTSEGKIFTIVPDNVDKIVDGKPKQVFYPQKVKYTIEDFAVHANYKKQLVLRTITNDIFFVDLSFLRIKIPSLCKKKDGKDLAHGNEKGFSISHMWFGKNRFEYICQINNGCKRWVRYEIKGEKLLLLEEDKHMQKF